MSRSFDLSGLFLRAANTLAALGVTAMGVSVAACSSTAAPDADAEDNSAAVVSAPRASAGDDTTCASIVLVRAGLDTPADASSKLSITATIDVASNIDVAKVGMKVSVRAYNLDGGGSYVSSGAPLTPQGAWTSLDAPEFFAPDRLPNYWTKVGPAPAGFQRLTFRIASPTSVLKNEKFDVKDVDFNRLRFDVVPYAIDKSGAVFNDRNYNHAKFDDIDKEIPYASLSQLSAFGATDALYCCTGTAESTCIHESYPKK